MTTQRVDTEHSEGAAQEHSPARPEAVVAYLQNALVSAADSLPATAYQAAAELRAAAHDLPSQVESLGDAFDLATSGGEKLDPFRSLRDPAVLAIASTQRASNSDRIIYAGVGSKAETLSDFKTSVTTAFIRAGLPVSKEPTPYQTATAYGEARKTTLDEIKAEVDAILSEAEGTLKTDLGALKTRLITEAVFEHFGAVASGIEEVRRALKIDSKLGAAALSDAAKHHNLSADDLISALAAARRIHSEFGAKQFDQVAKGQKLLDDSGLIPTAKIQTQIAVVIESYGHRLGAKLTERIRSWLPTPARRAPANLSSGLSRGEVMVETAIRALTGRGVEGAEMIARLRSQAGIQLDARVQGSPEPLSDATRLIDQLESDLRSQGKL